MATTYRQLQPQSMIDVGARTTPTGAPGAAQALAEKFSSFSRASSEVGSLATTFAAQKAKQAGLAEGEAGTPNLRKGIPSLTAVGRAYNSAAETAYVAKVHTDIDDTMNRLEQESEADAAGFEQKSKEYSDGLLNEVPQEVRPVVERVLAARQIEGGKRVRAQQKSKEDSQSYADYLTSVPAIVNNTLASAQALPPDQADDALVLAVSDNKARLAELVKNNIIDPVRAVELGAQFHLALDKGLEAARLDPIVENLTNKAHNDVQAGDIALGQIEQRKDLSLGDKTKIRKAYEEQRNLLSFERSRQFAEESGGFAKELAGGSYGKDAEAKNLALYKHAAISVDEYQSNAATIQRNSEKGNDDALDIAAVQDAIANGRGLDPTNTKQRAALDKLFKASANNAGIAPGDPRWQTAAISLARKTNILPASAESWARVNMMSGDPTQVIEGASFFGRAQEANPTAWDYEKDPKLAAFAEQINSNMAAGVTTERAFEMAHKNVYEQTDFEKKILEQKYRDDKIAKDNGATLQSTMNGDDEFDRSFLGMGGAPAAPLGMQAEYNGMVERMYGYTGGDVEKARKLAYDAVKSRYGYTQMNGKPEVVKYAPEKMYPGLTPEIIRQDVTNTIEGLGGAKADKAVLDSAVGLRTPGNLDPYNRKVLKNADGSVSTTSSMSIGTDQGETLIPTVVDGVRLPKQDAIKHFNKTGEHLGVFDTPEHADAYAQSLHNEQARRMGLGESGSHVDPSKVRISPIPETDRTKGRVWMLQAPDEYGAYDVVRDGKNQPVLYALPLGEDYGAAKARIGTKKVEEAKRTRELLQNLDKATQKQNESLMPLGNQ